LVEARPVALQHDNFAEVRRLTARRRFFYGRGEVQFGHSYAHAVREVAAIRGATSLTSKIERISHAKAQRR
jgi:hypothetical protein